MNDGLHPREVTDSAWAAYYAEKAESEKKRKPRENANGRDPGEKAEATPDGREIARLLDIHAWAALDIPPEPKLLGDLITPSSRVFFSGRTGLGKTLLAHAIGAGMASGQGFLHWRAERPSRCLIVDGEMPTALIKARAIDLIRRVGEILPGNLIIYSQDRAEEFARLIPGLGMMPPLNTEDGLRFVMRLVDATHPESILFDNVMSLLIGDQKDEITWSQALPLVAELTKNKIGQVWYDHTGHNTDRQYGSATKAWRFDTAGILTSLPEGECERGEIAFKLSFEPPGKARRRTPENWSDFETCTIRLSLDRWTSELASGSRKADRLSPNGKRWHQALINALCHSSEANRTTRTAWFAEAVRLDLVATISPSDKKAAREPELAKQRKYIIELREAGIIATNGDTITLLDKSQKS